MRQIHRVSYSYLHSRRQVTEAIALDAQSCFSDAKGILMIRLPQ
jgi:hypothetical protein